MKSFTTIVSVSIALNLIIVGNCFAIGKGDLAVLVDHSISMQDYGDWEEPTIKAISALIRGGSYPSDLIPKDDWELIVQPDPTSGVKPLVPGGQGQRIIYIPFGGGSPPYPYFSISDTRPMSMAQIDVDINESKVFNPPYNDLRTRIEIAEAVAWSKLIGWEPGMEMYDRGYKNKLPVYLFIVSDFEGWDGASSPTVPAQMELGPVVIDLIKAFRANCPYQTIIWELWWIENPKVKIRVISFDAKRVEKTEPEDKSNINLELFLIIVLGLILVIAALIAGYIIYQRISGARRDLTR